MPSNRWSPRRPLWLLCLALLSACSFTRDRSDCQRDADCAQGEVCYSDDRCVPRELVGRVGGRVGDQCSVVDGKEVGCSGKAVCRTGYCVGGDDAPTEHDAGRQADATVDASAPDTSTQPVAPGVACSAGTAQDRVPLFGGLFSATADGADAVLLSWFAAADETPAFDITYLVFQAVDPGPIDFTSPPVSSVRGETSLRITGLTQGTAYVFAVRAVDALEQIDCNAKQLSATPRAPGACVDFAADVQPILNGACTICHKHVGAPRDLDLTSYAGLIAGGVGGKSVIPCESSPSLLYVKVKEDTPPVGVRMPFGGPYLSDAQLETLRKSIDQGASATCPVDPTLCPDSTAPTFAGISTATATTATSAQLCWNEGSDSVTAESALLYDVYAATTSGTQLFAELPYMTSAPGETCVDVTALSPEATTCFVVRARDEAGNRDGNLVEQCVTTPAVPPGCVDYASMIEPLLERNCTRCHSGVRAPQWLRLDSYAAVLEGSARRDTVLPCDAAQSVLLQKVSSTPAFGARMPGDGPPYLTSEQVAMLSQWVTQGAPQSCPSADVCADAVAPSFAGVTSVSAAGATTLHVCWDPASDGVSAAADIRYDLYQAVNSGGQSFSEKPNQTVTGVSCADVAVGPGTALCLVVRARDLHDNRDTNTQELCATSASSACAVEYDSMVQPIFFARCTHCHDAKPGAPRGLNLTSHAGALSGGSVRTDVVACDWASSLIAGKTAGAQCGERMPLDGPPWLSPAELSILEGWMSSGARRTCSDADPCSDATPPSFAGASSANSVDATTVEVCWSPASDDKTEPSSIVYEVYDSLGAGNEDFTRKAPYAASGGTSCVTLAAPMATPVCYVVRARDLAGNRDSNSNEVCATTAGACFAYDSVVQPVFDARCVHCHSGSNPPKSIAFSSYASAFGSGAVTPCLSGESSLLDMVGPCDMPQDTASGACQACLTQSQIRLLTDWVDGGANPDCPWGGCP